MIQATLVAELVLGYLSDEGLSTTREVFQKECLVLQESTAASDADLGHTSLKQIVADYLLVKSSVSQKDTAGNAQLLSLWKKFDGVVGQLKYATLGKDHSVKTTQSARTRRLNQEISTTDSREGTGTKSRSPHRVPRNPPHTWQPARQSPKRNTQTLRPLKHASAEKGNFRQVINPALGDLSNALLPLPPFVTAASQQSLTSSQPVIGQVPCFIGQIPVANPSGLIPYGIGAVTHPLMGFVPRVNGQAPLVRLSGAECTDRRGIVPGQPSDGPSMSLRGQFSNLLATEGSNTSVLQSNVPPTSDTTQAQAPQSVVSSPSAMSNPCFSSPIVASVASGSCASSPINVEDVSPFGSPSPISTAAKGKSQGEDFVCEVVEEGDTPSAAGSANTETNSHSGMLDKQRVVQGADQTLLTLGSPRRKCTQPRRRAPGVFSPDKSVTSSPSPLPNCDVSPDVEISSLVDTAVPHFLDTLLNEPRLQEKLAENINKIVASSKQDSSKPEESAVEGATESNQDGQASASDLLSLMEADPAFESLFSFFGEDAFEVGPFDEASGVAHVQPRDPNPTNEVLAAPCVSGADSECTAGLSAGISVKSPATSGQNEQFINAPPANGPLQTPGNPSSVGRGNPPDATKGNPPIVSHVEDVTDLPHSPHVRALDFSSKDPGTPKQKTSRGRKKGTRNPKTLLSREKRTKDPKEGKKTPSLESEQPIPVQSGAQSVLGIDSNSSHDFPKAATSVLQALAKNHLGNASTARSIEKSEKTASESAIAQPDRCDRSAISWAGSKDSNGTPLLSAATDPIRLDQSTPAFDCSDLGTRALQSSLTGLRTGKGGKSTSGSSAPFSSTENAQTLQTAPSDVIKDASDGCSVASSSSMDHITSHGPRSGGSEIRESILRRSDESPERVSSSVPKSGPIQTNCPKSSASATNSSAVLNGDDRRPRSALCDDFPRNVGAEISGNSVVPLSSRIVEDTRNTFKKLNSRGVCSETNRLPEAVSVLLRNVDTRTLGNLEVSSSSRCSLKSAAIPTTKPWNGRTESSLTSSSGAPMSHHMFPGTVDNSISEKFDVSSSSRDVEKNRPSNYGDTKNYDPGQENKESSALGNEAITEGQLRRGKKRRVGCDAKEKVKRSKGISGTKKSKNKEKAISFPAGLDVDKFLSALHYEDK